MPGASSGHRLLQEDDVALVGMQAFADGQHPFSMGNLTAVRQLASDHGKRLILVEGLQRMEAAKMLGETTIVGIKVQARRR